MPKQITIEYAGRTGTGRNKTSAKADAVAQAERALAGDYVPHVVAHRDTAVLVFRDPEGWNTAVISGSDGGFRPGRVCWGTAGSLAEAMATARMAVAQLAWRESDGTESDILETRDEQSDFRRWSEYQLRYRQALRRGMSDHDACDYANRNPARPEIWRAELSA